ncbi:MAG TPA: 2-amino-4-hydroxy-6-hydroxymethyldihydropteridine diphosphokinase [Vicinamibacteria bacterium]|nr:2-amino-4-hydroxy-6-hydroxymethyldihydropteridine diphosphokinase [Vicinamibacteria bacterium]
MRALVALGSNLGDREENLRRAVRALPGAGFAVRGTSSVYETEPVGGPPQGPYLNAVVLADTALGAAEAVDALLGLERDLGRRRTVPNAPRVIDLDLLLLGDLVADAPRAQVPHPRMHERRFVLEPLCEVAAEARHPRLGRTACELLAACPDRASVRRVLPPSALLG